MVATIPAHLATEEQRRKAYATMPMPALLFQSNRKVTPKILTPDGEWCEIVDAPDAIPLSDTEYRSDIKQAPSNKPNGNRLGSNEVKR